MDQSTAARTLRNAAAVLLLHLPIGAWAQNPEWVVYTTENGCSLHCTQAQAALAS